MPAQPQLFHSQVYSVFKGIDVNDYHARISYFEKHEQAIIQLEQEEYFELVVAYCESLFETGAYLKFNKVVPAALESAILYNIKIYKGQDIFQELLFKKAAAHYNLYEYTKAEHILRELVKIDPTNELSSRFLKKCLYRKKPRFVRDTRAISVSIFLLTSLVIAIEILFVRNFFKQHLATMELTRNILFVSGWAVLICGELIHYWKVGRNVDFFKKKIKRSKRKLQPPTQILEEV